MLEPTKAAVKLKVTHTIERDVSKVIAAVSDAWPKILSNLKSLVERVDGAVTTCRDGRRGQRRRLDVECERGSPLRMAMPNTLECRCS